MPRQRLERRRCGERQRLASPCGGRARFVDLTIRRERPCDGREKRLRRFQRGGLFLVPRPRARQARGNREAWRTPSRVIHTCSIVSAATDPSVNPASISRARSNSQGRTIRHGRDAPSKSGERHAIQGFVGIPGVAVGPCSAQPAQAAGSAEIADEWRHGGSARRERVNPDVAAQAGVEPEQQLAHLRPAQRSHDVVGPVPWCAPVRGDGHGRRGSPPGGSDAALETPHDTRSTGELVHAGESVSPPHGGEQEAEQDPRPQTWADQQPRRCREAVP